MKNRIFIKDWLEIKPYQIQTSTDAYYLKLSNAVRQKFNSKYGFVFNMYITPEDIDLLSCFLVSWFEDVISGTNIWNTFVNQHQQLYGKKLPFYDTTDYFDGEINTADIAFLLWYFVNTIQHEKFVSPYNDFITGMAEELIELFDEEYEYAPENEVLKTFYTLPENETDYYRVRVLADTLLFKTWLFYPDSGIELSSQVLEIVQNYNDENTVSYLNETRDNLLHKHHARLLGLSGMEWAACILDKNHPVRNELLNLSPRLRSYFFYKGQNETDVFIEHIASGKKFNLTKKSFDYGYELTITDTILFMGIVQWMSEWWFSGIYIKSEFNADLVLDEKNSVQSRMEVNFLDHGSEKTTSVLEDQQKAFLDMNNGSPVAFMPTAELNDFVQNFMEHYNNSLHLSPKDRRDSKKRVKASSFFGNSEKPDLEGMSETALVYFNPDGGVEIAMGINNAFPLPHNPFFSEAKSEDDIIFMMMSEEISVGLVHYGIQCGKDKLPFYNEGVGKLYLNDLDFLLRFWKKASYFSKPEVTFVG